MKINLSTAILIAVVAWYGWMLTTSGTSPVIPLPQPQPKTLDSEAAVTMVAATNSYRSGMADLYRSLAKQVESGDIATVEDFAKSSKERNRELREAERQQLEQLMEKRLGSESLDQPSAAAFLREMADAFEGSKP